MTVVMVTSSAFPYHNSGVAYVVHNTAKYLTQMGHQVFVIGLDLHTKPTKEPVTPIAYEGYTVIGLTIPGISHSFNNAFKETDYNNPLAEQILEPYLQKINPDLVHFHSLQNLGAGVVKKAKSLGYKTVVTMHDWWWLCPFSFMADHHHQPCNQTTINQDQCKTCIQTAKTPHQDDYITKRDLYLKEILKNDIDLIIPVSRYVESFLKPNGITRTKVITIPNGVEPYNNQGARPTNPTATQYTNLTNNKIRFGFLGGKHDLKGYDLLIEACQELQHTVTSIAYQVQVYGTLQLGTGALKKVLNHLKGGNIKDLFRKIKRHLPIKNQEQELPITYYPLFEPEEKDQVYEGIDVLLALSKVKESSSLVVREALIRGIPVITTPSGGPEEVIINGKSGIILKESTSHQLKLAMEQIIMTSSLKTMKAYIKENPYTYTCENQAEKLMKLYETL